MKSNYLYQSVQNKLYSVTSKDPKMKYLLRPKYEIGNYTQTKSAWFSAILSVFAACSMTVGLRVKKTSDADLISLLILNF